MIVKKTKQLGNFKRGINIYVPKRIVAPSAPSGIPVASTALIIVSGLLEEYGLNGTYSKSAWQGGGGAVSNAVDGTVYYNPDYTGGDKNGAAIWFDGTRWRFTYYNDNDQIMSSSILGLSASHIPSTGWLVGTMENYYAGLTTFYEGTIAITALPSVYINGALYLKYDDFSSLPSIYFSAGNANTYYVNISNPGEEYPTHNWLVFSATAGNAGGGIGSEINLEANKWYMLNGGCGDGGCSIYIVSVNTSANQTSANIPSQNWPNGAIITF